MYEQKSRSVGEAWRDFLRLESAGGLILVFAAVLALVLANTPLADLYTKILNLKFTVMMGSFGVSKPILLWVNDGLMAVFFFLIGLEIKREIMEGELSSVSQIVLPSVGALGGMVIPASIYIWMNWGDAVALDGWAIPVATDIAFALALLSVFGSRVPTALKVFLLTLAIFDDLAAIVIIALFYSADLSLGALLIGAIALIIAVIMNKTGVTRVSSYILLGVVLWIAVLKSGVHATLAGVLIAFCIPMRDKQGNSPLRELENDLHSPVAFVILPAFAFANAGLSLAGMSIEDVFHPVTLGVVSGLFIGKALGILGFVGIAVGLRFVLLPKNVNWIQLLGVAFACGIGFTMSLFIAGLAFEHGSDDYYSGDRLGILLGSTLSALVAYALLHFSLPKSARSD